MARTKKLATSLRLTPEARAILSSMAQVKGISQSAVMEMLLREKAGKEGKT